jgi:hypothetical protein
LFWRINWLWKAPDPSKTIQVQRNSVLELPCRLLEKRRFFLLMLEGFQAGARGSHLPYTKESVGENRACAKEGREEKDM